MADRIEQLEEQISNAEKDAERRKSSIWFSLSLGLSLLVVFLMAAVVLLLFKNRDLALQIPTETPTPVILPTRTHRPNRTPKPIATTLPELLPTVDPSRIRIISCYGKFDTNPGCQINQ